MMRDGFSRRRLGRTGLDVCAMALGCYSMSSSYGARSELESIQTIHRALGEGINLLDTADYYGAGHNEELVGRALRGRRDEVLLSSKFGFLAGGGGIAGICGEPGYVKTACEASLRRLGTDHLDLYFQHRLDPDVPVEETVGAMAELVEQGKVRFLGLCDVSEQTLRRACAVHPITAVQAEYSLLTRDLEQRRLAVCQELGVTLMAFSPLGRGMLTGKLRSLDQLGPNDVRRRFPRFHPENFPKNLALVDRLGPTADAMGLPYSQLALAWLFHKNPDMVALCGCDTIEFLLENIGALHVRLDDDRVRQLSGMFAAGEASGDRYGAAMTKMFERS